MKNKLLTVNNVVLDEKYTIIVNELASKALGITMSIEDTQHLINEFEFIIDWDVNGNLTEYFVVESIPERVQNKTAGRDYYKFKLGEVDITKPNQSDLFFNVLQDTVKQVNAIIKYDKIIKDYYDKFHKELLPHLKKQRKEFDFILNKLESFYFITNYISSLSIQTNRKTEIGEDDYESALLMIMTKASLDLYGIFHCLYNGLEGQAEIIHRSLYESYVYLVFILKDDTENKLILYHNFQHVKRWNHIQQQLRLNSNYLKELVDSGISQDTITYYEKKYNEHKDNYNLKRPHHWAYSIFKSKLGENRNPTFKTIVDTLGLEYQIEYNTVYGTTSLLTHPSSIIVDYYTFIDELKRNTIYNSPMYKNTLVNSAVLSLDYCAEIILLIIKYFNINELDGLTRYIKQYRKVTTDEAWNFLQSKKLNN